MKINLQTKKWLKINFSYRKSIVLFDFAPPFLLIHYAPWCLLFAYKNRDEIEQKELLQIKTGNLQ